MTDNNLVKTANETLQNHEIFGNLLSDEEKQLLMERGAVCSYGTGQYICRQFERDSTLFIVLIGEVEVSEGENRDKLVLANLGKGEVFGEISALFRIPRISNVQAAKPSVILEIAGDVFEEVIEKNPTLLKAIIQRFGDRLVETALRSVSMLRHTPIASLQPLITASSLMSVVPGVAVVKQGEPGDALFIVIHGAARVTHIVQGQALPVAIMGPGDYFGEWSILTGAPRTANVETLSHVELIRIDREAILSFIQDNPDIRDRIDQVAHLRHDEVRDTLEYEGTDKLAQKNIDGITSILGNNS